MSATLKTTTGRQGPSRKQAWYRRRWFLWTAGIAVATCLALVIALEYVAHNAGPILRKRIIATLSARFDAPVELDTLDITVIGGVQVDGTGLRIPYGAVPGASAATGQAPIISVDRFSFRTNLRGLLHQPTSLGLAKVDGITIHVPPSEFRAAYRAAQQGKPPDPSDTGSKAKISFIVHEIQLTNGRIIIDTSDPKKAPREFLISSADFHGEGLDHPLSYTAVLTNPIPKGIIHASGSFGPWNADDPQFTPVSGDYTFDHADLNTIKGIGGILHSKGRFDGLLNRMTVDGFADVPDFSLDTADHPMPLHTVFHAFVDGTTGDTTLTPVNATLARSHFTCSGIVQNIKGLGHDIALNVVMPDGRMEDMLQLAVKTDPPLMRGALTMKAKLHIPPGKERVTQKLQLAGSFDVTQVSFTNPKVQDTIDGLSMRAQGKPQLAQQASNDRTAEVRSDLGASFHLDKGMTTVDDVRYQIPGALVLLNGVYSLNGEVFEFKGHVRTDATASQMVTGWKSILLKPLTPFLRKNGAGMEIPVEISGTKSEPHFGLALHGADDTPQQIAAEMKAKTAASRNAPHAKK